MGAAYPLYFFLYLMEETTVELLGKAVTPPNLVSVSENDVKKCWHKGEYEGVRTKINLSLGKQENLY